MNFKHFCDLIMINRTEAECYKNLQIAYESVVDGIRLHQHMFPVIMQKAFRNNKFATKHKIGNNYICFKEIKSMNNSIILDSTFSNEVVSDLEVFEFDMPNNHGIPIERYTAVNENQTIIPELIFRGDVVECANMDKDVFIFLYGYPYPYPVLPIGTEIPLVDNYSISNMVEAYTEQYLEIDDALACLIIPKYFSVKNQQEANIALANNYDYMFVQMLNKSNECKELFTHNNLLSSPSIPYKL